MRKVYLDNNATTPLDEEVKQVIKDSLDLYGNPSSHHEFGREARKRIEEAREKLARFINAKPSEIVFTSGGSESNNIVLRSLLCASFDCPYKTKKGTHIITSSIEHPSILETCRYLKCETVAITYLPVNQYGIVSPDELEKAIRPDTALISVMYANNEVGTIQPIAELAEIAHAHGIHFHTDAVQAPAKIPIDVEHLNADFLSLSGHKMYAPKGVGILYIKQGTRVCPLISGGHQETGIRAGTENTLGIIAMGKAAEVAMRDSHKDIPRVKMLRDRLERGLLERIPYTSVNGHPELRAPNTLNVSFKFIEGEAVLYMLDHVGIAVSTGSACSSGSLNPSHVLTSMGTDIEKIHSSIRLSLGKYTSEEDIDYVVEQFPPVIEKLRRMSPFSAPACT
ncbi:MAG: IscS subfamily cysteine desulfurase [Candidatus Eremiobacteraeota bacterium]|nr:IscS subfamily cysteine desulfurase [Candidatus Eremiobacteraeota bacterium]